MPLPHSTQEEKIVQITAPLEGSKKPVEALIAAAGIIGEASGLSIIWELNPETSHLVSDELEKFKKN